MWRLFCAISLLAGAAAADTVVPTRTIRAQQIIVPEDLALRPGDLPGAVQTPEEAVGKEARVTLYPNRPLRPADFGPPALVDRNQIVPLFYAAGPLQIQTEGRALSRGGAGDVIRVMNLSSRTTVTGHVTPEGTVVVGPAP